MRLSAIVAICVALGCGGGNKPAEAMKVDKKQEPKTEAVKTDSEKPAEMPTQVQWKVSGDTVTTASGLKYLIKTPGTGENAKQGDKVIVHTTGWFLDGSKFYSSYDGQGAPLDFPLGATPPRVIAGWEEALPMMNKGAKWQLIVPANLAYGESGRPPMIPPKSTLIFDVELLDINPVK